MQYKITSFETTVFGWDASTGDAINCPILVFDVGLNQLCDMFGLNGHEKSFNPWNGILYPFHVSVGDYVVIDTTTICGVMLGYSYLMFAGSDLQYARHYLANMITEDTRFESIHQYEIWHVCDDDELWHDWDLAADLYWNDECYDNWLAEVSDGPHYFPTVVHKPELMSEDYLSSLKTANASSSEHCYYCGLPLSRPYTHAMEVNGTVELVCGSCLLAHSGQSLGDCFMQVLRGLEDC